MVQHAADIDQQLARVVDSLAQRFAGVHDRDAIARSWTRRSAGSSLERA